MNWTGRIVLLLAIAVSASLFWRKFGRALRIILDSKRDTDFQLRPLWPRVRRVLWEVGARLFGDPLFICPPSAVVLALGPLSVRPGWQRQGVGKALVHAVLGAADARNEPLVVLLGSTKYYPKFGFRLASEHGITPKHPEWAPHFQVRTLTAYDPAVRGEFAYSESFNRL